MKNKPIKAFTLIEILVWVAIMWIIALSTSSLNFSRLTQNERLNVETVKITNILQEIKNDSLIGRWLWINAIVPDAWRIDISKTASGTIQTFYSIDNQVSWISHDVSWKSMSNIYISDLQCAPLTGAVKNITGTARIILNGANMKLTAPWCIAQTDKNLLIKIKSINNEKNIKIYSLSSVIEIN